MKMRPVSAFLLSFATTFYRGASVAQRIVQPTP